MTLVSKDSVKNSDHFDVLCVLIACMVLEIINQMSKNQKSSLIVWNTVLVYAFATVSPSNVQNILHQTNSQRVWPQTPSSHEEKRSGEPS